MTTRKWQLTLMAASLAVFVVWFAGCKKDAAPATPTPAAVPAATEAPAPTATPAPAATTEVGSCGGAEGSACGEDVVKKAGCTCEGNCDGSCRGAAGAKKAGCTCEGDCDGSCRGAAAAAEGHHGHGAAPAGGCPGHGGSAEKPAGCGGCGGHAEKPAGCGGHAEKPAEEAHEEHASCGGHGSAPPATETVATDTPDGGKVTHGGGTFAEVPEVSVTELVANPDKYAGQQVQVVGDVSAMCHHRRGWFAVAAADGSGAQIRVITMPAFLVPQEAIGTKARAQGKVEVVEVDPRFARHLSADHGLPAAEKPAAPVKRVVLRAAAADFVEAP